MANPNIESGIYIPTTQEVRAYGDKNNWHLNLPAGKAQGLGHYRFNIEFWKAEDDLVIDFMNSPKFPNKMILDGYSNLKLFGTFRTFFGHIDRLLSEHDITGEQLESLFLALKENKIKAGLIHEVTADVYDGMVRLGYNQKDLET